MAKKYFGKHYVHGDIRAIEGIDVKTVEIPFTPDYIKVEFQGPALSPTNDADDDEIYWNLTRVDYGYTLDIAWCTYSDRLIHYKISQLSVDPV